MNIYIKNISHDTSSDDLKTLFSEYGTVTSAKVIIDSFTGRSRGFAFVEIEENEGALRAIKELDQATYDGRIITLREAQPKSFKPRNNSFSKDNKGFNQRKRW